MGWEPEVIWHTPVPQIFLALEGKYDFVIKTNPFGGGKKSDVKSAKQEDKTARLAKEKAKALKFDMMMMSARNKAKAKENG